MKLIVLGMFLVLANFAQAQDRAFQAVSVGSTDTCVIPKVDGERVPFPIKKANTKFELAEGETYLLNGTLVMNQGRVFLKVDFDSQPWLATDKMMAFPYFEVSAMNMSVVQQFGGRLVQIAVVTKGEDSCSPHVSGLKLSPILPPALTTLKN